MNARQRRRRAHDLRAALRRVRQHSITENTVITIHCYESEIEFASRQAQHLIKMLSPPPKSIVLTTKSHRFEVT